MTDVRLETRNSKLETPEKSAASKSRSRSQTLPLLLEVGCEEIPARFLHDTERGLGERIQAALKDARLLMPSDAVPGANGGAVRDQSPEGLGPQREPPLRTYSTPRRLVVHVPALLGQQPDKVQEIFGPPVKVAIDAEGKYTRAAESFAQKNSARLEDLARTTTAKGEYLFLRKTTQGRPAREILPEILPGAILALTFPRSMYWTSHSDPRFVRPIRWVLAILGEGKQAATVDFEILGVKSGNCTFGHRVRGTKPLAVTGFKNYSNKLRQSFVEIDPAKRLERVSHESQVLVEGTGFKLVSDEWLADWIVDATEWPHPILGNFDERFLHLPREILITVMRDHQKYFALEQAGPSRARLGKPEDARFDGNTQLAPHFVAVLNMDSDEKGLIRQGHERVLTARFRDAEFFWTADQKTPLERRKDALDRVTYQVELGSYGEKVGRMRKLAEILCRGLESQGRFRAVDTDWTMRAVDLCKCDLTTQMVQEFPELQGVVGGLYGKAQGESKEVYEAIYDHYRPLGAEDACPRSLNGAVVSISDKLDAVTGGFLLGREPTGSSDPFGLRRQANGIIKVLLEFMIPLSVSEFVNEALDMFESRYVSVDLAADGVPNVSQIQPLFITKWKERRQNAYDRALEFFADRLRYYLGTIRGFRYDTVQAVLAAGADRPTDALARAEAMGALRGSENFEALSVAAKRIRNILAKSASAADWSPGEVEGAFLSEPLEKELYEAYGKVAGKARTLSAAHDYRGALEAISSLRPVVDRFFDKVLVMAEDREVRQNRLRLLKKLDELLSGVADFAEIEGT